MASMGGDDESLPTVFPRSPNMLSDPLRRLRFAPWVLILLAPSLALMCAGCDELGVVASKAVGEEQVAPVYTGFKGQHVAIMVWADEAISADHPTICADVAGSLQDKLQQGIDAKMDELKGTTFVSIDRILRFQEEHPETQSDPAEQIAPRLPASRLIYIEIQSLSLHPNDSVDLSRGQALADVKVLEVKDGHARSVYENDNVSGVYPPDAPPEGLPNLADEQVYRKSVDALTTELGKLFITHPAEPDHDL
jgi:hypothetical protein